MLFNSLHFFIFFPIVVLGYFFVQPKRRWALLLLASYYFYMSAFPQYGLLLAVDTAVNYALVLGMARKEGGARKMYLYATIAANIGLLAFFKYYNFFVGSLWTAVGNASSAPLHHFLLPIGISFHTFQIMSYAIDVYKQKVPPERHFGIFALYISFFPQMVAGPIERATTLLPQFHGVHEFDYARVTNGLKRMVWGLFKKVVIADRLAIIVNTVYGNVDGTTGMPLLVTTIFFAWQIYCDFSGYTDMALGAAQVLGFRLMENFNHPYAATSVQDFWRRWHISLSSWFREYVYIPCGGNRNGLWRTARNIIITFLLSGLWHGANWTFVIWGLWHGVFIVVSMQTRAAREKLRQFIRLNNQPRLLRFWQTACTFTLVSFTWIFFRAATLGEAKIIVGKIVLDIWRIFGYLCTWRWQELANVAVGSGYGVTSTDMIIAVNAIIVLEGVQHLQRRGSLQNLISSQRTLVRWLLYYALIIAIAFFGVFGELSFIYFQF